MRVKSIFSKKKRVINYSKISLYLHSLKKVKIFINLIAGNVGSHVYMLVWYKDDCLFIYLYKKKVWMQREEIYFTMNWHFKTLFTHIFYLHGLVSQT